MKILRWMFNDAARLDRNWYEYKGGGLRVTNITGENEREQSFDTLREEIMTR